MLIRQKVKNQDGIKSNQYENDLWEDMCKKIILRFNFEAIIRVGIKEADSGRFVDAAAVQLARPHTCRDFLS